jgi:2-succinyl-5-enolpyruvyl-6-hydroxy-3-cyclohexene-1-carboxylate synthase
LKPPNIKYLWANLVVEELLRNGVSQFCISPGSRNCPLVLAVAENPKASSIVHLDERGTAFYALGYGKAHGVPAALISTSGTAVANYFPAVIEASLSTTPIILLTADRPVELRDTGANQAIDQVKIYGEYIRWFFDLPSPTRDISPKFVLTTIDQAVYRAIRSPAGPVHINCQFAEPLTPEPDESVRSEDLDLITPWEKGDSPLTKYSPARMSLGDEEFDLVTEKLTHSTRGLIVAGPLDRNDGLGAIRAAAESLKMPLLADVGSCLRFGKDDKSGTVTHYDLFLREPQLVTKYQPDFILHLGRTPVSTPLNTYLEKSDADYILVNNTPFRQDPGHRINHQIETDPIDFCRQIADNQITAGSELRYIFEEVDQTCSSVLEDIIRQTRSINELAAAHTLLKTLTDNTGLLLANSMPVRDADTCGVKTDRDIVVGVNRGVSGIDGTISSAAGFARGLQRRTILLTGDLAFAHDLNALLLVKKSRFPITIVLVNNNGGGIFSFLPIADYEEHFESYFGAPHGLDFKYAASSFDLEYRNPVNMADLQDNYRSALKSDCSSIIEVNTDRRQNFEDHRVIWDEIRRAVQKKLD